MTDREQYVLGYRQAEQERLQEQALQLADESAWMFDQIGLASGARINPCVSMQIRICSQDRYLRSGVEPRRL